MNIIYLGSYFLVFKTNMIHLLRLSGVRSQFIHYIQADPNGMIGKNEWNKMGIE